MIGFPNNAIVYRSLSFRNAASASLLLVMLLLNSAVLLAETDVTNLTSILVADGFSSPVFVTSPPGDFERLFVVEQGGRIEIIKNGSANPSPFLDIGGKISTGGERGLLGLAFHPDYAINGFFYVNYTDNGGDTRVARYNVTGDPDIADLNSELVLMTVAQPFSNHNAGMLAFSPIDGYLYIGFGDGGSGGDPGDHAQDSTEVLGKMLRIDVDSGSPYTIPSDNPFIGHPTVPEEIWAFGLRNPWRYSFDRETGDLYIADVGQSSWEEIDFQPSSSTGGENYGWRLMEGGHCFNPSSGCDPGGLTYPIHEYPHSDGCSVTGGYVYRGCAIPDLQGTYFFADYCSARIWSFRYDGVTLTDFQERTAELVPGNGRSIASPSSFGEDAFGEVYIVDRGGGEIFKIVPEDTLGVDCNENGRHDNCDVAFGFSSDDNMDSIPDECQSYVCGDANASGDVDIDDVVYLIAYIFAGGSAPEPIASGDANCISGLDIDDVVYLITFIFSGGFAPCDTDGNGEPNC